MESKVVCYGEVLWDVFPDGKVPGGAPMNVCYHLNQLGIRSTLVSRLGRDEAGKQLLDFLSKVQIPTDYIQRDDEWPTGTVLVGLDNEGIAEYEIVKPSAWDNIQYEKPTSALPVLVYGSLASRSEVSFQSLLKYAAMSSLNILDINLRFPHVNWTTLGQLLHMAHWLKINEEEMDYLAKKIDLGGSLSEQFNKLVEKYSLSTILMTRGADGAICWRDGLMVEANPISIDVVDTVGAGDGFLAGFIASDMVGKNLEASLSLATKVGAWVAGCHGATPIYDEFAPGLS